jgi:uncharacterized repeat protein (TIGR01451 family)
LYVAGGTATLINDILGGNSGTGGNGGNGGDSYQGNGGAGGPRGNPGNGGAVQVGSNLNVIKTNGAIGEFGEPGPGGNGGAAGAAGAGLGGGLYVAAGTVALTNDTLSGDTAQGGNAGNFGLQERNFGQAAGGLDGGAGSGGGVYVAAGTVALTNDTLSSNNASGGKGGNGEGGPTGGTGGTGGAGSGGGTYVATGSVTMTNDTLSSNNASGGNGGNGGGGARGGTGGTGGAGSGGGTYVATGIVAMTNDTLTGNNASGGNGGNGGGAAFHGGNGGSGGNGTGGGLDILSSSTTSLNNTLVAQDTVTAGSVGLIGSGPSTKGNPGNPGSASAPDVSGTFASSDHDLIGDGTGSNLTNGSNGNQVGTSSSPIDPLLDPKGLQNNGGPLAGAPGSQKVVQTIALQPGSPAIDAGNSSVGVAVNLAYALAVIADPGFETPALVLPGSIARDPTGSPWTFTGLGAGLASNLGSNGSLAFNNAPAPQGNQVAFLQQSGCSISQVVNLPAGTYVLNFMAAQRPGNQQTIQVQVDGTVVATVTPLSSQFALYTTSPFGVQAGSHTIKFVGTNPLGGDNTAFLDQILIGPPTDQSGRPRISGSAVDIGAYEVQQASLNPATLANGSVNTPYSYTFTATQPGYQSSWGPFSFSYTGALPGGLSLASDGTLSGTPFTQGPFQFTVEAKNLAGFGFQQYSILINPPLIAQINGANSSGTTITLPSHAIYNYNAADNSTDGGNALPVITGNVTIIGNGATIERTRTNVFRLFDVAPGGSLTLENVTLTGGLAAGTGTAAEGGAIYSAGTLSLSGVTVKSNKAFGITGVNGIQRGAAGGTGASASGGGLYVAAGNVTLTNDILSSNSVRGGFGGFGGRGQFSVSSGKGGTGGNGGAGLGGAMYVAGGTVTLTHDTISGNKAQGGTGAPGGTGINSRKDGSGGTGGAGSGGGLYVAGGTVTLTNDTLKSNTAQGGSGGLGLGRTPGIGGGGTGGAGSGGAMDVAGGTVTLTKDTISGNKAQGGLGTMSAGFVGSYGGNGGAAYGGGLYLAGGTVTLTDDTLSNNTAQGGKGSSNRFGTKLVGSGGSGGAAYGGGMYVAGGTVTLTDDTLNSNNAQGGLGALGAPGVSNGVPTDGNSGGNGGAGSGGGLYVADGTVTLTNDTLSSNGALGGDGGQGGNGNGAIDSISGGNGGSGGAGSGGAVDVAGGTVTLINDTLAYNGAVGGSGAAGGGGSSLGLLGVAGNGGNGGSASGGGLYLGAGTTVMANTLIAENGVVPGMAGLGGSPAGTTSGLSGTDGSAIDPDVSGTVAYSDHDLIGTSSDFSATKSIGDIVNLTTSLLTALLDPSGLQDNGGPTKTVALQAGSKAIDAGDPTAAVSATDQRGLARIVGNGIDIGAYEYNANIAITDLSVSGTASSATVLPGGRITYTLTVTNSGPNNQSNVALTDVLPANTTLVAWTAPSGWSSGAPPAGSSGTVAAWIATLPVNSSVSFTLVVQVASNTAALTVINNTASVGPTSNDPDPSTSVSLQTTVQAVTSISLSASNTAPVYGQTVALTATVTTPTGDPLPTSSDGTVTFYDGGTKLGTMNLSGNTATLPNVMLAAGQHTITASYSGDNNFAPCQSVVTPASPQAVVPATGLSPTLGPNQVLLLLPGQPAGPTGVAVDSSGDVFIADPLTSQVVEFKPDGTQSTVGSGLSGPEGVAVDQNGNVYIADTFNNRVVQVTPGGTQTTEASGLNQPRGVAVDKNGFVFVTDAGGNLYGITPGGFLSAPVVLLDASGLNQPYGVAVDSQDTLFIAESANNQVVELRDGTTTTLVSGLNDPRGVAVDSQGDLYIADTGNNRVLEVTPNGTQTPLGSGLNGPWGVALDSQGDVFIPDTGNTRVVEVQAGLQLTVSPATPTVAVSDGGIYNAQPYAATATAVGIDGKTPVSSSFSYVYYAGSSATGTASTTPPTSAGTYTVVATFNNNDPNYASGGTTQTTFLIRPDPTSISVSASNVASVYGQGVTLTATVTTPAGSPMPTASDGTVTFYVDGAVLGSPQALSGSTGTATLTNVTLAAGQHRITASYSGDNNFATSQSGVEPTSTQVVVGLLAGLNGSAYDAQGDVFFPDPFDNQVLELKTDGTHTTVGSGLLEPIGVAVDAQGDVFIDNLGLKQEVEVLAGLPLTVSPGTPTVSVSDAGGAYTGNAFVASDSVAGVVAGVDSLPASTLEGVAPTLTYYQGTYATLAALDAALAGGLTGSSMAPSLAGSYTVVASFAGSSDYSSGQALATFTIDQATPTVSVSDASLPYNQKPFAATDSVAGVVTGVDSTPASSLEGVAPTLTYYQGTYPTFAALNTALAGGLTGSSTAPSLPGSYTVVASFAGSTDYSSRQAFANFTIKTPTASISGPTIGVPGQPLTYIFAVNGPTQGIVFTINYGDGTTLTTSAGGPSITLDHLYHTTSTFTIQVTAKDGNGVVSQEATQSVKISTVAMESDPSGGTALAVGGNAAGGDTILVSAANTSGTAVNVTMNKISLGTFTPTGHILVYGQGAKETITLQPDVVGKTSYYIEVPAFLYGEGSGGDHISAAGSAANNVLTGHGSNEVLTGGQGRDLLIAGTGAATLNAGVGDDILIGGSTNYDIGSSSGLTYDKQLAALDAIMAEWGSAASSTTRLNALAVDGYLTTSTVHDNSASGKPVADQLLGNALANDWFFAGLNDVVKGKGKNARVTSIT